jgi:hypothetical protein
MVFDSWYVVFYFYNDYITMVEWLLVLVIGWKEPSAITLNRYETQKECESVARKIGEAAPGKVMARHSTYECYMVPKENKDER